ncbi:hypothetical protein J6590_037892 [Homalodisca vitripennis]|nr:hypothetical protein J6590_037892 [Homalodisca vitripennis]
MHKQLLERRGVGRGRGRVSGSLTGFETVAAYADVHTMDGRTRRHGILLSETPLWNVTNSESNDLSRECQSCTDDKVITQFNSSDDRESCYPLKALHRYPASNVVHPVGNDSAPLQDIASGLQANFLQGGRLLAPCNDTTGWENNKFHNTDHYFMDEYSIEITLEGEKHDAEEDGFEYDEDEIAEARQQGPTEDEELLLEGRGLDVVVA